MRVLTSSFLVFLLLGFAATVHADADRSNADVSTSTAHVVKSGDVDIPFTRFVLPNGLTVVVSEDHKAPVVAVSVWYHVGSANEPKDRSGFAHLFEHLMFQGSENHRDEFFKPFEAAGATDQNGTTWLDRTNYFETVPTTALDMALWMESDRMGHLLGAIGQPELDEQRGVVKNEKRQRENQPYGRADGIVQRNAFPANHPYHHETVGSMADLDAASLDDVKQWFRDWYGAANVTVALVGDITPEVAREKMIAYFGDIAPGRAHERPAPWTAQRGESTRGTMNDQVAQVRIYREWNIPDLADADIPLLDLAATVLGDGRTSRLYQRLVYTDKLADDVSVYVQPFALAGMFSMEIDVKNSVDPAQVENAVAEEWQRFLTDGPTEDELLRARTGMHASLVRGLERVNGKASLLAQGQLYRNDPAAWKTDLARADAATPESVAAAARRWIAKGDYTLTVSPAVAAPVAKSDDSKPMGIKVKPPTPAAGEVAKAADTKLKSAPSTDAADGPGRSAAPDAPAMIPAKPQHFKTVASDIERSKGVPGVDRFPDLEFPKLQHGHLANGIEVVLAERHAIPVVQVQVLFDAGYASDEGRKLGTSSFAMATLDEGTTTLDSLELARRSQRLGAVIAAGSGLDFSNVRLSALDAHLDPSLSLFADIVRNPAFRDADIERLRGQWLAGIAQEKTQPTGIALRTLPPLLYGAGHAYAIPFTGSGTVDSISSLTRTDLKEWAGDWLRPDNARILVAGDTTLGAIIPKLDKVFGDWKAPDSKRPAKNIAEVAPQAKSRVFLVDRPGAQQTLILAGLLAPPTGAKNSLEIQTMNGAFGGIFTSRLNMNLREDKHWAYGAGSFLSDAVGQRPWMMYAPVQTDKTAESMAELLRETREVIGDKPLTDAEIEKIKVSAIRSMPGDYQTTGAVLAAINSIVQYDRPDDYVQTAKARIRAQTDAAVEAAAREVIRPDTLTWVVVGDLDKIEASVRKLDLGEVKVMDVTGKVVR